MKNFLDTIEEIEQAKTFSPEKIDTDPQYVCKESLVANAMSNKMFRTLLNIVFINCLDRNEQNYNLQDIKNLNSINNTCTKTQFTHLIDTIKKGANLEYEFKINDNDKITILGFCLKYFSYDTKLIELLLLNNVDPLHIFTIDNKNYTAYTFIQENFSDEHKKICFELFNKYNKNIMLYSKASTDELISVLNDNDYDKIYEYMQKNNYCLDTTILNKSVARYLYDERKDELLFYLAKKYNINTPVEGKHILTFLVDDIKKEDYRKTLNELYSLGLDVNYRDKNTGKTLLMYSAETANYELFDFLISKHARVDLLDYSLNDIWKYADNTNCYSLGICKILTKFYPKQASIYTKQKELKKIVASDGCLKEQLVVNKNLEDILSCKSAEILCLLLEKGHNKLNYIEKEVVNILINNSYTNLTPSLNLALKQNDVELVEVLLNKGANPNEMYKGKFPLEIALLNNNVTLATKLVSFGAVIPFYYSTTQFTDKLPKNIKDDIIKTIQKLKLLEQKNDFVSNRIELDKTKISKQSAKKEIDDLFSKSL